MPSILLRLPALADFAGQRPSHCPYCGQQILQSWGQVARQVRDAQAWQAGIRRYRCSACQRTFRAYPAGVDRAMHTLRVRRLAGLACALGMTCRDVAAVFEALGMQLSRMAVWREAQELSERMNASGGGQPWQRYLIDRVYVPAASRKLGVVLALDAGQGKPVILGILDEHNPQAVKAWLEPLVADFAIEVRLLGTGQLDQCKVCHPPRAGLAED
jgi:DNA-directed RNA polymerase subunit RPC12/RpoP